MTVVCPNCDARFRDPPADIAVERPLQCSACEHEWLRTSPSGRALVEVPPLAPTMQNLVDDKSQAITTNLPVTLERGQSDIADAARRIFVDVEPEIAIRRKSVALPIAGLAVLALMVGAVSLRGLVLEHVPQARSVYETAGLNSPAPELEIATIETRKSSKDGIRQLIIRGEIENMAAHAVPVPPLRLTMRGESNIRLYAWTVSAAKDNLKAGERSRFTAVAHDYPGEAVDVEVEFVPPKDE